MRGFVGELVGGCVGGCVGGWTLGGLVVLDVWAVGFGDCYGKLQSGKNDPPQNTLPA